MLSIRRILHPTDFSDHAAVALGYAILLARHYAAELHVVHVTAPLGSDPIRDAYRLRTDEATTHRQESEDVEWQMRTALAPHQPTGVLVRRVHLRGPAPAPVIVEYERGEKVDLVVMGTHGRRGVRRVLVGSVAEEVAHRATSPVLCVRHVGKGPETVRRILAPFDFSASSIESLACAGDLAVAFDAHLDMLHVLPKRRLPSFYDADGEPGVSTEKAVRELEAAYETTDGPDVPVGFHATVGRPSREIEAFVDEHDIDLIVLASHGQTGTEAFSMGQVAGRVLTRVPCSVLLLKPFGHSLDRRSRRKLRRSQVEV